MQGPRLTMATEVPQNRPPLLIRQDIFAILSWNASVLDPHRYLYTKNLTDGMQT
jgi:hypothetical protein